LHCGPNSPAIDGEKRFGQAVGGEGHDDIENLGLSGQTAKNIDVNVGHVAGNDSADLMGGGLQAGQDPGHGALAGNCVLDTAKSGAAAGGGLPPV